MSLTLPSWMEALILGLVQGLTGFLPVSSSTARRAIPRQVLITMTS